MNSKKLFIRSAILIFSIFILNFLAGKFYWYYSIWYFDMIMHFCGGFFISLLLFWLLKVKEVSLKSILKIILGVLIIGVLWEFFEIMVNKTIAQNPFNFLDTISDIFFDLAGGSMASIYFLKRIFIKNENKL
jgi:hypothetical protein